MHVCVCVHVCKVFMRPHSCRTRTHARTSRTHKLRDRKKNIKRQTEGERETTQLDIRVSAHISSHAVARVAYHVAKSGGQPEFRRRTLYITDPADLLT